MEKKVFIRKVNSKPPTTEQRSLFYSEIFKILEKSNVSTQNKLAEEIDENVFVLRENYASGVK